MWEEVTRNRDAGSPEWLPIYQQGQNLRFSARAANLARPVDPWGNPRIVYLQHASDPIAWWNPDLLFRKPDWLSEKRGYDVLGSVDWIPFVTFLQVSADMAVVADVPDGHGHRYVNDVPMRGRPSCSRAAGPPRRPTGFGRCCAPTSDRHGNARGL
jgi:uncharacterized membrane protein